MIKIEPNTESSVVTSKEDCINLTERWEDSILTSLQIRLEENNIHLFVTDYDRNLVHRKMSYKEFKEEILKIAREGNDKKDTSL